MPRKGLRFGDAGTSSSAVAGGEVQQAGDPKVRVIMADELLEDGDLDMDFADRPPELAEVENLAAETEIKRLTD